jgi:hypothetical protein
MISPEVPHQSQLSPAGLVVIRRPALSPLSKRTKGLGRTTGRDSTGSRFSDSPGTNASTVEARA